MPRDMTHSGSPETIPTFDPAAGLLAFLDHVERLPDVVARRQRSCAILAPRPGETVADIGCGSGAAAREIAALLTPGGTAVGLDINEALIAAAGARAAEAGVEIRLVVGDALALPFADASLHGYRAERLYQHLGDPRAALIEAKRALAPGGRIVIIDQDWDATLLDSDDVPTTRAVLRAYADGIVGSATPRRQHRLLTDAGFTDVRVEAEAHASTRYAEYGFIPELAARVAEAFGAIGSAAAERWIADQRERGASGRWFASSTHLVASARRP